MHLIAGVNRDTHHNSIASSQLRIGMGVLLVTFFLLGPASVCLVPLNGCPAWSRLMWVPYLILLGPQSL